MTRVFFEHLGRVAFNAVEWVKLTQIFALFAVFFFVSIFVQNVSFQNIFFFLPRPKKWASGAETDSATTGDVLKSYTKYPLHAHQKSLARLISIIPCNPHPPCEGGVKGRGGGGVRGGWGGKLHL